MQLRDYQIALVERVRAEYRDGARSVLMVCPTGSGKTRIAAEILRMSVERGRRCLFLAELDVILVDTHKRLTDAGLHVGFVQAGRAVDSEAPIQLGSLDTISARGSYPVADFVVLDEAHMACAATVRATLERYPNAFRLGLTATPVRSDERPLSELFSVLIEGPSIARLQADGFLVPVETIAPVVVNPGTIACEPAEAWQRWTPGRRAIVFARDLAHAEHVTRTFRAAGVAAECILGDTPRDVREAVRARLVTAETLVLCSVNVCTQGFDCPPIEVAILARTFSAVGPFLQAAGRVLRPSPSTGKSLATFLDLGGSSIELGLVTDNRQWALDGSVRRVGASLAPLARCGSCLAIFHRASSCPRCGVNTGGARLPRRATRVERAELRRLDARPQAERDALALRGIERRLLASGRYPSWRIPAIAKNILWRSRRRRNEAAA